MKPLIYQSILNSYKLQAYYFKILYFEAMKLLEDAPYSHPSPLLWFPLLLFQTLKASPQPFPNVLQKNLQATTTNI